MPSHQPEDFQNRDEESIPAPDAEKLLKPIQPLLASEKMIEKSDPLKKNEKSLQPESPESSMKEKIERIWSLFKHDSLLAEIARLESGEKTAINKCVMDLINDLTAQEGKALFGTITKRNGDQKGDNHGQEHQIYPILPNFYEIKDGLEEKLIRYFIEKKQGGVIPAMLPESDLMRKESWEIRIFPHPEDSSLVILSTVTRVPHGNSYGEGSRRNARSIGCSLTVSLSEKSKTIALLKKYPQYARVLPFILRNTAVYLDGENALMHLDAPIGSTDGTMNMPEHTIKMTDFRNLTVTVSSDNPKKKHSVMKAGNVDEFNEITVSFGVGRSRLMWESVPREEKITRTVKKMVWNFLKRGNGKCGKRNSIEPDNAGGLRSISK